MIRELFDWIRPSAPLSRVNLVAVLDQGSEERSISILSSWGMCPGNEESAGKHIRRRITPGNRWLKQTLAQAAWAASRKKNAHLAS